MHNVVFVSNMHSTIPDRLADVRHKMYRDGIDWLYIPTADPHASEYLPAHFAYREYLSGFDGSAGALLICQDLAYLFTDSRYFIQAHDQLAGTGIILQKDGQDAPVLEMLEKVLRAGQCIGVPFWMLSQSLYERLSSQGKVRDVDLDAYWTTRPGVPMSPLYLHNEAFCDQDAADKLERIRNALTKTDADAHLISTLGDIAYLTNVRASDVEYNPFFLAHFVIAKTSAVLYLDASRIDNISDKVRAHLSALGISLQTFECLEVDLKHLGKVWYDPDTTVRALSQHIAKAHTATSPVPAMKAQKTPRALNHLKDAMLQDGIALAYAFARIDECIARQMPFSELEVGNWLYEARASRMHFVGESFATIAGFNENGARPHYQATQTSHAMIEGAGLLLIDSGAQYQNGTTDITRMVKVGDITPAQRQDLTLVMRAHIALARATFPDGVHGAVLDGICRAPMWQRGQDFLHGTGHGVGYFLGVHEGPVSISYFAAHQAGKAVHAGMVLSNEPALYRVKGEITQDGQRLDVGYGIRLENLMAVIQAPNTPGFLCFETLTLFPFDSALFDANTMTTDEIAWLNAYNAWVYDTLKEHLDAKTRAFLGRLCIPLANK